MGLINRIKTASTRTKMVAVFVHSRKQSTQRGSSLATVAHWLLTGITTRGTGADLRYQIDVQRKSGLKYELKPSSSTIRCNVSATSVSMGLD